MWSQADSGEGMDWEYAPAWVQQKNQEYQLMPHIPATSNLSQAGWCHLGRVGTLSHPDPTVIDIKVCITRIAG